MNRSLLKNLGAAVACGLCLASAPSFAAGLLGERYVALSYGQTFTESDAYDNGGGVTLFYNHPLSDTIDLGGSYSTKAWDGARDEVGDFSDQRLQLMVTAFGVPELDRIWVRLGGGLGMVELGDEDTTKVSWLALIGTEYTLSDRAVLQPYAGWNDVLSDHETPTFVYGLQLVYNASEKFGVNVRIEGDHRYNGTLSLGVIARF